MRRAPLLALVLTGSLLAFLAVGAAGWYLGSAHGYREGVWDGAVFRAGMAPDPQGMTQREKAASVAECLRLIDPSEGFTVRMSETCLANVRHLADDRTLPTAWNSRP